MFAIGDWIVQTGRDIKIWALVIGQLKNGSEKVIAVEDWRGKAVSMNTSNWYPAPKKVDVSEVPKKFVDKILNKQKMGSITELTMPGWKEMRRDSKETVYYIPNSQVMITVRHGAAYNQNPVVLEMAEQPKKYFKFVPEAIEYYKSMNISNLVSRVVATYIASNSIANVDYDDYLLHNSFDPDLLTNYNSNGSGGRFEEFMFFGEGHHYGNYIYGIDMNKVKLCKTSDISMVSSSEYKKIRSIIEDVMDQFDVDSDEAHNLLCEQTHRRDAEEGWDMQIYTARAGVALGYDGCWVGDEYGVSAMIDMKKNLKHLVKIEEQ